MSPPDAIRRGSAVLLAALASALSARADGLALGRADFPEERAAAVGVALVKANPVTGVQFDLRYPVGQVGTAGARVLDGPGHEALTHDLSPGLQRVVVLSRTNAEMPADLRIALGLTYGPTLPAGGPSLEIRNIVFTDAAGGAVPATALYTRLEDFRRAHFTEAEREDPLVVGDDRDPDGDGQVNLAEAFAARHPRQADAPARAAPILERDAQGRIFLALRFLRSRDAATLAEIEAVAEAGDSVPGWTATAIPFLPTGNGDAQAEEVEARLETTGRERHFLHVFLRRRATP